MRKFIARKLLDRKKKIEDTHWDDLFYQGGEGHDPGPPDKCEICRKRMREPVK